MRRVRPALLLAAAALLAPFALAVEADELASGLAFPVALAFAPDGKLYFAELNSGKVRELRPDGSTGSSLFTLPASPGGNGGLTGLAIDGDGRTFYVVYSFEKESAPHGKVQRVSKVVDGQETVLLDDIPWAPFHVGGRIAIGPDDHLYVTTGDNGGPDGDDFTREPGDHPDDAAQDPASRIGKVLRMTKAGAAAGGVAGWDPYVHAMGFRNPFGLVFAPDGTLYAAENGILRDELNVVVQGGNYGWPLCEGDCADGAFRDPLTVWDPSSGTTGAAVLDGTVFVGEFSDGELHAYTLSSGAMADPWSNGDAVVDVAAGPDGCLYVSGMSAIWQVDVRETGACRLGPPVLTPTPTSTPPPTTTPTPPPTTTPTSATPTPPATVTSTPPATATPPPATPSATPATPPPTTVATPSPPATSSPPAGTTPAPPTGSATPAASPPAQGVGEAPATVTAATPTPTVTPAPTPTPSAPTPHEPTLDEPNGTPEESVAPPETPIPAWLAIVAAALAALIVGKVPRQRF